MEREKRLSSTQEKQKFYNAIIAAENESSTPPIDMEIDLVSERSA
jgi:hypothetical protein